MNTETKEKIEMQDEVISEESGVYARVANYSMDYFDDTTDWGGDSGDDGGYTEPEEPETPEEDPTDWGDSGSSGGGTTVTPVVIYVTDVIPYTTSLTMDEGSTGSVSAYVCPEDATNQSVYWSSSDTSVVTVTSGGSLRAIGKGTATLTATAADGGGAFATVDVWVRSTSVSTVVVSPDYEELYVGDALQLTANVYPYYATVKDVEWCTDNSSVATVDGNGYVTTHSAGSAIITVRTVDGGHEAYSTVMVYTRYVESVTLDSTYKEVIEGERFALSAVVHPENATVRAVEWCSDNESVATVENGIVTAHSKGNATITVRTIDGGYEDCCHVSVNEKVPKKVTVISCTPEKWISSSETMGGDMATIFNSEESYVVKTPTNASEFETCWNEAGECIIVHTHGNPNGLYDHGVDAPFVSKANIANLTQNDTIHFIMVTACETAGGDEDDNVACWLSKKINSNGIVIANKYKVGGYDKIFEAVESQDGWRVYRNGVLEHMPIVLTMAKAYEIFKIFTT